MAELARVARAAWGSLRDGRRMRAPEVVQISTMDCGPAVACAALQGFGCAVNYEAMREACQTSTDGTSIDALGELFVSRGLEAVQTLLPSEHIPLPEANALPAVLVTELLGGTRHFVLLWRAVSGFVQVMDPAHGRRWLRWQTLAAQLHHHSAVVPADAWRAWAGSAAFLGPLSYRLRALGLGAERTAASIERACEDGGAMGIASLDASARMAEALVAAGVLQRGTASAALVERSAEPVEARARIPAQFWFACPPDEGDTSDSLDTIRIRGPVLLSLEARARVVARDEVAQVQTPAVAPSPAPEWMALALLRDERWLLFGVVCVLSFLLGVAGLLESLLLHASLDLGRRLGASAQRASAVAALLAFQLSMFLLELPVEALLLRLGRRLELRARKAFMAKLPRLGIHYFQSRLHGDLAERAHTSHQVRWLPARAIAIVRSAVGIAITCAGLLWLAPGSLPIVALVLLTSIGVPLACAPRMVERDLQARSQQAALTRFHLDALLGIVPLRTHAAERAVQREHESLLVPWVRSSLSLQRFSVAVASVQGACGIALVAWLIWQQVAHQSALGGMLLLGFWATSLPLMGAALASQLQQYPALRNVLKRVFEPLLAPSRERTGDTALPARAEGMSFRLRGVEARIAGHEVLRELDLDIGAGSAVAVVGRSGAGKSSLASLLLGMLTPSRGALAIDGIPLGELDLTSVWARTAWVDPSTQLWNRSLLDNLYYGVDRERSARFGELLDKADLRELVERLPEGLQTHLGEGGALVSGGEGQRVRFGRALLREDVRLLVLDEPFRGLDRQRRRVLLQRARAHFPRATVVCVTHDVSDTLDFDMVLVIEDGRLVEHGSPGTLQATPHARFRAMLESEQLVRQQLWHATHWRRLWVEGGSVRERSSMAGNEASLAVLPCPVLTLQDARVTRHAPRGRPTVAEPEVP